ncbi:MAG: glycosyltransferase family 2 protein [Patescibacteria group bacterium]|nr:glycosyltransferase family 2 protein [Patescibacteria group bacterium]
MNDIYFDVIIVTVNKDKPYLKGCLKTLEKSALCSNISLNFIIVANGTKVSRPTYIKSKSRIIELKNNIGFGSAVNIGLKYSRSKWFFLSAPDVRIDIFTLKEILKNIHIGKVAIIGPKIHLPNNKLDYSILPMDSFVTIFLEQSYLYKLFPNVCHHSFSDRSQYLSRHCVDGLSATFLLINRYVFLTIGSFDKRFFLFHDDTDLCHRIILINFKIIFDPNSSIKHLAHKSTGGIISAKFHAESYYIYLMKYYSKVYTMTCLVLIIWGSFMRWFYWLAISSIIHPQKIKECKAKRGYYNDMMRNCLNLISKNIFSSNNRFI